jgi:hypothetical protein
MLSVPSQKKLDASPDEMPTKSIYQQIMPK